MQYSRVVFILASLKYQFSEKLLLIRVSLQLQQAQQAQQIQEQQQIQLQQQQQYQAQSQPQYASQQINQEAKAQPQQQSNLLRVAYSPSNEVSQVKYTSNGLNYNF